MLDVAGADDVDPSVEQLKDIFVTLAMLAALDIRVRQLVNDSHPRAARQDRTAFGVDLDHLSAAT